MGLWVKLGRAVTGYLSRPGVAKDPSATQLTRIRCGAHSTLTLLEAAIWPAREAMVCGMPTLARVTGMTRLTITPGCPRSIQHRAASCIMYQVPLRLVSRTAFQPLGVMSRD